LTQSYEFATELENMNTKRIEQLMGFLQKAPEDAFTLYSLAYEYLKGGDVAQPRNWFSSLKTKHPDYVGLYYHLGKTYAMEEKWEEAIKIYDQGLEVATQQGDAHAAGELQRARQQVQDELEDW